MCVCVYVCVFVCVCVYLCVYLITLYIYLNYNELNIVYIIYIVYTTTCIQCVPYPAGRDEGRDMDGCVPVLGDRWWYSGHHGQGYY